MRAKHIVHFNELKSIFCQVAVCAFLINGKNVSYLLEVLPIARYPNSVVIRRGGVRSE